MAQQAEAHHLKTMTEQAFGDGDDALHSPEEVMEAIARKMPMLELTIGWE